MNQIVIVIPIVLSSIVVYMTLNDISFTKNMPLQPGSYKFGTSTYDFQYGR